MQWNTAQPEERLTYAIATSWMGLESVRAKRSKSGGQEQEPCDFTHVGYGPERNNEQQNKARSQTTERWFSEGKGFEGGHGG